MYGEFSINARLIGLLGARGVGKTTLLIQYIKAHSKDLPKYFYFSADHIYFSRVTLYEFIEDLYLTSGIRLFFIDEIHKYKNWSQEIKNIYDAFPSISIVFSGSSSLDLIKGGYDLSRRATLMHLQGMSFREYLNFKKGLKLQPISFNELLSGAHDFERSISTIAGIKGLFQDYLKTGFYPFAITETEHFHQRLLRIIDKTIYEDIANYYNLSTGNLHLLKKILVFLASIAPGQVSTHNIAKNLSIHDKTVNHYLRALHETGLIRLVFPYQGGSASLRKPEKIFLNNTNLIYALKPNFGNDIEIGTIRELMFLQSMTGGGENVYFSQVGDYWIKDTIFEIAGANKKRKQIKSVENAYLVKDQLVAIGNNIIPLLYCGFLY